MSPCICGHDKAVHLSDGHCWRCCNNRKAVYQCLHDYQEDSNDR